MPRHDVTQHDRRRRNLQRFGKRKPYLGPTRQQEAAAKVAVLLILGGAFNFGIAYWIDDAGISPFIYIFGFAMLVVALIATHEAMGLDDDAGY